jgi:transcriptional regulator with XRE-family HTH domain
MLVSTRTTVDRTAVDDQRRKELAAFLRSRRAALTPDDEGLPANGRRRTPGLRREEVAVLSDVSVTWYTFLEQGRPIRMSADTLARVGAALRLGPDEVRHLFLLAGRQPPRLPPDDGVPAPLVALLESLITSPAWIVNSRYDVLASNRAAAAVWVDLDRTPRDDRNLVWLILTHPVPRRRHLDWESDAKLMMIALRARFADHQDQPAVLELVDRLEAHSPEFRAWWPQQEIVYSGSRTMEMLHPVAGRLRFSATTLRPELARELRLMVWTPESGTEERVRHLLGP